MEKFSWQQILDSDLESIEILWYGSLIDTGSHHNDHVMTPIVFEGFKRTYNLPVFSHDVWDSELSFMKKYLKRYGITQEEQITKFIQSSPCVLNCTYTGNKKDIVNWLCLEIKRKDFLDYSLRECCYDLIKTPYHIICPNTGAISQTHKYGYVLVGHDEKIAPSGEIFHAYHEKTRQWAYRIWEYFGKLFDATTYHLDELVIKKSA